MALPGTVDEKEVKTLLKKLLDHSDEVIKFAVVARGPKDGDLILSKKQRLKKKEVQAEAEAEAKNNGGGKSVKLDVIAGECRLHAEGTTKLRLTVHGKVVKKAVDCAEHLLLRGPYKTIGFTEVILEETEEPADELPTAPSTTASASSPEPTSDPAAVFAERLKALLPAIKAAAGTPAGEEAKRRAGDATVVARKLEFSQAHQLLDQVETLLKAAGPPTTSANPASLFTERLKAFLPTLKSAAGTPAGEQAKLKAGEAGEFARQRDFTQANQALDEAVGLLKQAGAETGDGAEESEFPRLWQSAKSAWLTASERVDDQISKLQSALKQSDDPDLREIAEFGLNAITAGHKVKLLATIRDVDHSDGEPLVDAAVNAQEAIEEFLMHLDGDERVAACDANPFQVPMSIRATLSPALRQLDAALQAVRT